MLVRCGSYEEHGMYLTSGVTLRSETGNPDCVVIDGDYSGSILIALNTYEPVCVEGISLIRGGGLTESAADGGGIHLMNSTAFIKTCTFDSNYAGSRGGAIYASGSDVRIEDCSFTANRGTGSLDGYGEGGAIYALLSELEVIQGSFTDNLSDVNFGGSGGAIHCKAASLSVFACRFEGNWTYGTGGAIYFSGALSATITESAFENNGAGSGSSITALGECAIEVSWSQFLRSPGSASFAEISSSDATSLNISHSNLIGSASPVPAVMVRAGAEDALAHCVMVLASGLAATDCAGTVPAFFCCDVYAPVGDAWVDCYADQLGVNGNLSADPQFCGEEGSGNYYLQSDSPCAPANNSCGELIGALPVGCEAVATQEASISAIKALY